MTKLYLTALCAVLTLGACAPSDIASRMNNGTMLNSGVGAIDTSAPQPFGDRSSNEMMRFSTTSLVR